MSEIKFGVIGAGQIAHNSCADIDSHDGAVIAAASDVNEPRLAELAGKVEESLAVQKILDGIYESCTTGKEVRIQ